VIDYFTIALTHGLIALAAFRLLWRDNLDREDLPVPGEAEQSPKGPEGR